MGNATEKALRPASPNELKSQTFAEGSMGPKVVAACSFVALTGGAAGIGELSPALAIIKGKAGTSITM